MIKPGFIGSGVIAMALVGFALSLILPCQTASAEDADIAALQAKAKKSFRDGVAPFVTAYCTDCHGEKKRKGGINFLPALKNPGDAVSSRRWRQALVSVKAHDMPPEEAKKQPTEEERRRFLDWIAQIKFLSPKNPGPFVIRRLTKVEYGNTLRDLFGVDPSVARELPDEVFGEGYLNTLSPLQSEQYLAIANEVLDKVLAPDKAPPTEVQKRLFGNPPAPGTDVRAAARG